MYFALAIGLSTLGWQADVPKQELVSRLTSPHVLERVNAARELEAMGEPGRKLLEASAESLDLELRAEIATLLDRIEGRSLSQASRFRLDLDKATILEATATITQRTGTSFRLEPEGDAKWRAPVVAIHEELTLWDAVDRILLQGSAYLQMPPIGVPRRGRFVQRDGRRMTNLPDLTLKTDLGASPPTTNSGAFRISVLGLRLYQVRTFTQKLSMSAPQPPENTFTVQIQVRAEPRLLLASLDDPVLIEATDDLGQSLLQGGSKVSGVVTSRGLGEDLSRAGPLALALRYPAKPGKTITVLKGSVKGLVVGRRDDPLIVSLDRRKSPLTHHGTTLSILNVQPDPNGRATLIQLSLDGPEPTANPAQTNGRLDARSGLGVPPSAKGYLDFLDANGRVCQSDDLGQMLNSSMGNAITIQVAAKPGLGPPVEARYYPASWSQIEVPFEFHNIPMP